MAISKMNRDQIMPASSNIQMKNSMTGLAISNLRVRYHSARSSSTQVPRFRQVDDAIQFELSRARYIAWPSIQTSAILPPFDHASLVTVISCPTGSALDPAWLQTYIHRQTQVDDVFEPAFLNGIIFTGSKEPQGLVAAQLRELLDLWGTAWSKHMVEDSPKQPCPGLYVWKNNALWNVYIMYDDFNGAFMASIRRCSATGRYFNLRVGGEEYQTLSVIVPSRTVTSPTKPRPLEGLRFAVKDMYRIEGLQNTLGSRSYYHVNVPATANAPAIQRLLDSGAYLVGTTKLACFAAREEPTECADYQAPYNPRGDGSQSPAGSSSGSAAATASYDFLDFTIGSDSRQESVDTSGRWFDVEEGCYVEEPAPRLGSCERRDMNPAPAQDQPQTLFQSFQLLQNQISQQDIGSITRSIYVEPALHSLPQFPDNCDDGWTGDSMAEVEKELELAFLEQVKLLSASALNSPRPRSVEAPPDGSQSREHTETTTSIRSEELQDASRHGPPDQGLEEWEKRETEMVVEGGGVAIQQQQEFAAQKEELGQPAVGEGDQPDLVEVVDADDPNEVLEVEAEGDVGAVIEEDIADGTVNDVANGWGLYNRQSGQRCREGEHRKDEEATETLPATQPEIDEHRFRLRGIRTRQLAERQTKTTQYRVVWGKHPNRSDYWVNEDDIQVLMLWPLSEQDLIRQRSIPGIRQL
ncbi:hypothetical protein BJ875DRAFT_499140 [Amylocarpus encephaloides]|uniref:Amidase domain-containing protein n=1 Tax=Amylocarpus encephaloides TaxID=45428 RepID=A0A9P7YC89_9HELO|nr:hypothetical protein BJ875DRAFT_499140 [Amylocarpus encephaloides]